MPQRTCSRRSQGLQHLLFMSPGNKNNEFQKPVIPGDLDNPPALPGQAEPFCKNMIHPPGGDIKICVGAVHGNLLTDGCSSQRALGIAFIQGLHRFKEQRMMGYNKAGLPVDGLLKDSLVQLKGHKRFLHPGMEIAHLQTYRIAGQGQ